jgi:hypothetical protein
MVMLNQSGKYLKVDDVRDGDLIIFKDEGSWVESTKYTYEDGNPKQDFVMKIEHKGNDYLLRINKYSRDEIVPVYGQDTKDWVGKQAKIAIENYRSLNKKGIVLTPIKAESETAKTKTAWDEEDETKPNS